jgi:hypothetical protein
MGNPVAFNPDDLSFVGKTPQAGGATQPQQNFNPAPVSKPISEVGALDENSIINISNTPDELPPMEVPPKGTYDCSIDSVKTGVSGAGNFKLNFLFRILNPGFEGKFISWIIVPGTDFGLVRFKQVIARSLKTDPITGDRYALAEKAVTVSYKVFADSGMAVGARVTLTGAPKTTTKDGVTRTNFNVTAVALPKTNSFM